MREIDKIIMAAREANASDIHITKGLYLLYRVKGTLVHAPMQPTAEETEEMLYGLLDKGQKKRLEEGYDIDFAIQTEDGNRQRVNVFRTQNRIAATIRLLNSYIPVSYTHLDVSKRQKLYWAYLCSLQEPAFFRF